MNDENSNLSGSLATSTEGRYFSSFCCSSIVKYLMNSSKFVVSYKKQDLQARH